MAAFDRSMRRLAKGNPDVPGMFEDLVKILAADPQNSSRKHNVRKLRDVEAGEGQWRIRSPTDHPRAIFKSAGYEGIVAVPAECCIEI